MSPEGEVTKFLLDEKGAHVSFISDVHEVRAPGGGSRIWLGSVRGHFIAYLDL